MELAQTSHVSIDGTKLSIRFDTAAEGKLALKELRLKKKEQGVLKRSVNERMKQIRAAYTAEVRSRGSMLRGGGGFGKLVRAIQTVSRDNKRSSLASELAPLEQEKQAIETVILAIDSAIIQVEARILKG